MPRCETSSSGWRPRLTDSWPVAPATRPNRRLLNHLANEHDHLFTFLRIPGVQAINWRFVSEGSWNTTFAPPVRRVAASRPRP
jgi:hypothetical protein